MPLLPHPPLFYNFANTCRAVKPQQIACSLFLSDSRSAGVRAAVWALAPFSKAGANIFILLLVQVYGKVFHSLYCDEH